MWQRRNVYVLHVSQTTGRLFLNFTVHGTLKLMFGMLISISHHGLCSRLWRGIYCLLVVATLLDILTPENTAEFISSCQTYEGGFASSSNPSYYLSGSLLPSAPRPPLGEAHGGYTFCAVASSFLLRPYFLPIIRKIPSIDVDNLLRWLVHMHVELGGFKGRTNKLVDGYCGAGVHFHFLKRSA